LVDGKYVAETILDLGFGNILKFRNFNLRRDSDKFEFRPDDGAASADHRLLSPEQAGTDLSEDISGFEGDDTLTGGSERDHLFGGKGNDTLTGTITEDWRIILHGIDGINSVEDLSDRTSGDIGFQTINLGDGNSLRIVGAVDRLENMPGIFSFPVADEAAFNDVITGTDGADTLSGSARAETINGGAGDDVIHGAAKDTLTGGAGNDVFVAAQGLGMPIDVTITDFDIGGAVGADQDQLDFGNVAQSLAEISIDQADAGTTLTFRDGDSMFLEGINAEDLDEDHFLF